MLRIAVSKPLFARRIDLYMCEVRDGSYFPASPIQFESYAVDASLATGPVVSLSDQEAQELMDQLWQCGLRPSEGTGSAGSLAATEKHLRDMQSIALGFLKKEGVL